MRIAVEIEKPLVVGFWVPMEDKGRVWVEVKYEKLVDFCFVCGRMGHVMKNCERGIEEMGKGEGRMRYGLWMKAALLKEWEDEYRPKGGGGERGVGGKESKEEGRQDEVKEAEFGEGGNGRKEKGEEARGGMRGQRNVEEKVKVVRRITELGGKKENWLGKIKGKKGEIG